VSSALFLLVTLPDRCCTRMVPAAPRISCTAASDAPVLLQPSLTAVQSLAHWLCLRVDGSRRLIDNCRSTRNNLRCKGCMCLLRSLRVHEESNINPNSNCGFIYGYYWWIFSLNFYAFCGAVLNVRKTNNLGELR